MNTVTKLVYDDNIKIYTATIEGSLELKIGEIISLKTSGLGTEILPKAGEYKVKSKILKSEISTHQSPPDISANLIIEYLLFYDRKF